VVLNTITKLGRGLEPLDDRTDPQTRLAGSVGWILLVKTKQKNTITKRIMYLYKLLKLLE
jgi:hypothetical protein